jgi:hypothetical protein
MVVSFGKRVVVVVVVTAVNNLELRSATTSALWQEEG